MGIIVAQLLGGGFAIADPRLSVQPTTARPGDPVLVTVSAKALPRGTANGTKLQFFPAKQGYQAVFAVPLDAKPEPISIEIDDVKNPATVAVRAVAFPETDLAVADEYANPPASRRTQITADNVAIIKALRKGEDDPQFTRSFLRPRGIITSPFGEWRTFNGGIRSRHLGFDLRAREGTRVNAVNAGTVTLVRDTFLAGKVVVVAHGGGIATSYFHLSEFSVAEGDTVARGDEVGRAGQTGRTTGPHAHVGVWVAGGFVDPPAFFKLPISIAPPAMARR